jgi:acyl carrier protein
MSSYNNPTPWRSDAKVTTTHDIRGEVLSVLTTLAPEVDAEDIRDDGLLRDQVDLDSMDWLNFLIGIHNRLHVTIPEKDYASLRTLTDIVHYIEQHPTYP